MLCLLNSTSRDVSLLPAERSIILPRDVMLAQYT